MSLPPESAIIGLACTRCGAEHDHTKLQGLCRSCGGPLYAHYDLDRAGRTLTPEALAARPWDIWRYAEVLPVEDEAFRITLGEGGTPLLASRSLGPGLGIEGLLLKDEGLNPTGSFKARGLCLAVSRAAELGAGALSIPTAGNAGGALSAYAAAAGMPAHIFMPSDTPSRFVEECRMYGAHVTMVDGYITDAGQRAKEEMEGTDRFDVSTLKEPYRVEGKKTMGYELFEQLGGRLPDVIIYPTGGGTGLVGMWKAFDEMEELGWVGRRRPRMVSVQAAGCAPVVKAFHGGEEDYEAWPDPSTMAMGLRVPAAVGDVEILKALRGSGGTAVAVDEEEILEGVLELGSREGIYASPEDGAVVGALRRLEEEGFIEGDETVVAFLTGHGMKYAELIQQALEGRGEGA
ncbi:MAG: threonine synthase [bacterium]